ncbi:MAG: M13 family metallopeptidase [Sulfurovum sp.]|nr:M13 family metallopeptidase [Sulfurovum sp.]
MKKEILMACSVLLLGSSAYASVAPAPKGMHSSWDVDKDGVNDCEKDGTCDDSVDYSLPRGTDVVSYRDNFYKAVNREWLASNELNPETGQVSGMAIMGDNTELQVKKILDRLSKAKNLTVDEQKIVDIYQSYMNVEQRNKIGITPLANDLQMIQSAKTHKDIAKLIPTLGQMAIEAGLGIGSMPNKKDSTKFSITAVQAGLTLTKETYLGKDKPSLEKVKIYRAYLTKRLSLAKLENVEKKVDDILKLETKLAEIQFDNVELRNLKTSYNPADFKMMDATLSNLNFGQALDILGIKKDMPFDITYKEYLKAFNELFVKIDVESWKSYLESQYIKSYGGFTITGFNNAYFEYRKNLGLQSKQAPMWKIGQSAVNTMADMLLGKIYIEENFDPRTKVKAKKIVMDIIAEYEEKISSSKLFSQPTKDRAMKKLTHMKFNIGYPDKWQNYDTFKTDKNDLFGNYKRYKAYKDARYVEELTKPIDMTKWSSAPQDMNAFYTPSQNKFVLLAAILQKPVFDINASDAKNYGGIGMVIAHEIGHGFDDQGSRYDYQGNVVDWWEKEDRVKYMERAKRLISQADHFEYLPGQYLNGKLEIGEIIGDLNGVTMALSAYEKIIKEKGLDRKTALKDFFISLAKVWRKKTEPHVLERIIHMDNHPVSEFRVNGILKNIDTFHEIFETKKGDGMYMEPSKRVKLW